MKESDCTKKNKKTNKLLFVQKKIFIMAFEVIKRFIFYFSWTIAPNFYSLIFYALLQSGCTVYQGMQSAVFGSFDDHVFLEEISLVLVNK